MLLALASLTLACDRGPPAPVGSTRPSPGRLWHEEHYRTFSLPPPDPAEAGATTTRGGAVEGHSREVEWLLAHGRSTRVLGKLLSETLEEEANPRIGTDLSAAYLTRAEQTLARGETDAGRAALDLIEAARWARRAVELDPDAPQPRFNYATALGSLALARAGDRQWQAYLELDPASGWAGEGRGFSEAARERERSRDWGRALAALAPEPGPETIRRLVADFGYESRLHVEKILLPAWDGRGPPATSSTAGRPRAQGSGDAHSRPEQQDLALGRLIAEELAAQRGEHLLADEIGFIESLPLATRSRLIEAHGLYAGGLEDYAHKRYPAARRRLRTACSTMRELEAPFRHACAVQYAIALNAAEPKAARDQFRELERTVPARYPTVRGRVHWMLGSAGQAREEWPDVLSHFERAARELERGAGAWRAAGAHALLGDALEAYGDSDAAWRHYLKALRATASHPDHSRRHGTLFGAVDALVRSGRAEQAIPFCDELVANADAWGDDGAVAEAYSRRAWASMEIGDEAASRSDIAVAVAAADRLSPSRLAHRSSHFVAALIRTRFGPWTDLEALEAAHRRYSRDQLAYERLPFLLARGRMLEAAGDLEASTETLLEAAALHEARGGSFQPTGARLLARSLAEDVYRRLVRQAVARGRPDQALQLADRSRWFGGRSAEAAGTPRAGGPKDLIRELAASFEAGTALIDYTVLDEQTLALIVELGSSDRAPAVRAVFIPGGKAEISRRVESVSRALAAGGAGGRQAAAEAHELLIAPLGLSGDLRRLIVVPDRALWRLSFGALVEPRSGRHLIQRAAVSLALSPHQAAAAAARLRRLDRDSAALVAGAPDLNRTRWRDRAPLPAAVSEIEAVAALYPGSLALSGQAVSKERLLASLDGRSIFHFAGHADVDAERREGARLLLSRSAAGKPGSDALSSWDLIDGDWSGLELVFLSACRTLEGYEVGREGLVGLGSVFVAGGALAAVVSRWDIDDAAASQFAVRFHRAYRLTRDPAGALRVVALEDLAAGEPNLFWASFAVLGG